MIGPAYLRDLHAGSLTEPAGSHESEGHASVNSTLPYQHQGLESIRAAIERATKGTSKSYV